jgi:hypothetical protein
VHFLIEGGCPVTGLKQLFDGRCRAKLHRFVQLARGRGQAGAAMEVSRQAAAEWTVRGRLKGLPGVVGAEIRKRQGHKAIPSLLARCEAQFHRQIQARVAHRQIQRGPFKVTSRREHSVDFGLGSSPVVPLFEQILGDKRPAVLGE